MLFNRVKGPVFPATREAVFDVINDCQNIENQTGQPLSWWSLIP